jgi:hypothetical protein
LNAHAALTLFNPKITCIVDKDRYIYDKEMPHLSFEVDELNEGDLFTAMVVDFDREKLYLTLQNSKIQGCKMEPITTNKDFKEKKTFLRLGKSNVSV